MSTGKLRKTNVKKKRKKFNIFDYKKHMLYGFIFIILFFLNKKFFLLVFFILTTTIGKQVRQMVGNSMIMLDPLTFYCTLIIYYWSVSDLFLFLFITVFVADMIANHLTSGSFINYFLFLVSPLAANFMFHNLGIMMVGVMSQVFYASMYIPIRIKVIPDDPVAVMSKSLTNILFVYLYIMMLGPIFGLLM
ncbi:MAG: hypothetical protein KKF44_01335 [Nanoarchaeota archaeon]|nr:hypothetical protein [Nanoarchaeota archaeon]